MKRIVIAVLVLFCASFLLAQEPATAANHFSFGASAMGFSGPGGAAAATIAGGTVSLTQRFAAGYEQVIVPSLDATYYFGTGNYTVPLPALLGKTVNSHLVFDATRWSATFTAGAGVLRQSLLGVQDQHLASTVGAGLNYVADSHLTVQVVSFQWLHANVAGPARDVFVVTPDATTIATGLKLTF